MAVDGAHGAFFGLSPHDEIEVKNIAGRVITQLGTQPLVVTKTLMQFGFEPFPLVLGKSFIFTGRDVYFLPNAFSYIRQLGAERGYRVLWTGLDATLTATLVGSVVAWRFRDYLDKYYPEVGGKAADEKVGEETLSHADSARRFLRRAIRRSVVQVASTIAARPFVVISIRQIAQIIGGEAKYTNLFQALRLIGNEEGPAGFFSGLVPTIIAELTVIWGLHTVWFAVERSIVSSGLYEKVKLASFLNILQKDEDSKAQLEQLHTAVHFLLPMAVSPWSYPFHVLSTVLAVAGSGLAVSLLPYSPAHASWQDAWAYLGVNGLARGSRFFLRQQKGAIRVGIDKQIYANNTHFA